MASSKLYFVALLIIASVFIDVQSTRKFFFSSYYSPKTICILHISKKLKIMTYHVYIIYIYLWWLIQELRMLRRIVISEDLVRRKKIVMIDVEWTNHLLIMLYVYLSDAVVNVVVFYREILRIFFKLINVENF